MLTYDPRYDRTNEELEEFLVFAVCVAGKNADQTIRKVRDFLAPRFDPLLAQGPFQYLRSLSARGMSKQMAKHRLGQYSRIGMALAGLLSARLDLRTCGVAELESIHGIGPKTARFFVMFNRPGQRLACLDTHILAYMRARGVRTPKSTPSGKKYAELESKFLFMCDEAGLNPTEMDYAIWQSQRAK